MCLAEMLVRYKKCQSRPLDPQIIMLCKVNNAGSIPLDTLFSQYRFALTHSVAKEDLNSIRNALVSRLSEDVVNYITSN